MSMANAVIRLCEINKIPFFHHPGENPSHTHYDEFTIDGIRTRPWLTLSRLFREKRIKSLDPAMTARVRAFCAYYTLTAQGYEIGDNIPVWMGMDEPLPVISEKEEAEYRTHLKLMEKELTEQAIIDMITGHAVFCSLRAFEDSHIGEEWDAMFAMVNEEIAKEQKIKKIEDAKKQIAVLASMISELEAN